MADMRRERWTAVVGAVLLGALIVAIFQTVSPYGRYYREQGTPGCSPGGLCSGGQVLRLRCPVPLDPPASEARTFHIARPDVSPPGTGCKGGRDRRRWLLGAEASGLVAGITLFVLGIVTVRRGSIIEDAVPSA